MIGRLVERAHALVNLNPLQPVRRLRREQQVVDADALVLLPRPGLIVPEGVEARTIVARPERVRVAEPEQARLIEGVFSVPTGAIRVCNIYLPNGNPVDSEKFPYKLRWMERLTAFAEGRLRLEEPFILLGDFNLIPAPIDAHHPDNWWGDALFRPESLERFRTLLHLGFTDALRSITSEPSYTFWDFQAGAWRRNHGIRIDHLLLSPQAADRLDDVVVHKDVRGWDKPSDHVPVEGWFSL